MTKKNPPLRKEWQEMLKLVNQISTRTDAEPFREAVDWRSLGLYDYPQVVKQPMDLGTVKKKIENGSYSLVQDCANDIRLIWKNCMTYNADGSEFYLLAEGFAKRFEEKFTKFTQTYASIISAGASSSSNKKNGLGEPSNAERLQFAKLLYKITKEELGKVINDLDEKCPKALTKNAAEDEVEINVDNISSEIFSEINMFVRKCAGEQQGAGKKKKAGGDTNTKGRNKKSKA